MMDLRERREEKRALALIRVGHPKQKKEGKIARLKNYIKSSYRSRCCCCREEKRRKERERVNYGATGNTRPFLLLLFYSVPFLLLAFVATTTTTKFDCVMTHRLGRWILFCCAFKTTTRFGRRLLRLLSVVLSLCVSLPLTKTTLFLLLCLLIRHRNRLLLRLKIRSLRTEMKRRKLRSTRFQSSRKEKPSTETHHIKTNF